MGVYLGECGAEKKGAWSELFGYQRKCKRMFKTYADWAPYLRQSMRNASSDWRTMGATWKRGEPIERKNVQPRLAGLEAPRTGDAITPRLD